MPTSDPQYASDDLIGAVDLGSNSFHLATARLRSGRLTIVDRLRERVRLAACLDEQRILPRETWDRPLAALRRFGEILRPLPSDRVRVAATNTLRVARNRGAFLAAAEAALGHRIDVISGAEEARLIFRGATALAGGGEQRTLVLDIGGGSTECVVGRGAQPATADSLYMGCVTFTKAYFPGGRVTAAGLEAARVAARLEVRAVRHRYLDRDRVLGASGTVRAAAAVERALFDGHGGVTAGGVRRLIDLLGRVATVADLDLPALGAQRRAVFPGGLVILEALIDQLALDEITLAPGALREGLMYELAGYLDARDPREDTVRHLQARFGVDRGQARRVRETALRLADLADASWGLARPGRRLLAWAAELHEVGLEIAHAGYHRHGAYLVSQGHLPGFAELDKAILGALIRLHRRKFKERALQDLPPQVREPVRAAALLLRLAVLLNRARTDRSIPIRSFELTERGYRLKIDPGWLAEHPLTAADLEREAAQLPQSIVLLR